MGFWVAVISFKSQLFNEEPQITKDRYQDEELHELVAKVYQAVALNKDIQVVEIHICRKEE